MKLITSNKNPQIKHYKSLQLKKNRIKFGEYLIEGFHLCQMALEAGVLREVILTKDTKFEFSNKIFVTPEIIKQISDAKTPQPILGVVKISYADKLGEKSNTLIVDEINDPGNLGTILRSALAFGYKNVVLSQKTTDLFSFKTLRATQGANFKLNIIKKNLLEFIPQLKIPVIATDLAKPSISKDKILKLKGPKVLIVGNEAQGIRKEVSNLATHNHLLKINNIDSLNVAIAASILMYQIK